MLNILFDMPSAFHYIYINNFKILELFYALSTPFTCPFDCHPPLAHVPPSSLPFTTIKKTQCTPMPLPLPINAPWHAQVDLIAPIPQSSPSALPHPSQCTLTPLPLLISPLNAPPPPSSLAIPCCLPKRKFTTSQTFS